ncbi:putative bifunctional diguanylate cyclase/phosphodiesterase [Pontibacillus marinus]|uniref:Signal peptide protein n=1 Tax=Pontibacillus marinus BH030004 = DSM 16465 TaxID=1385511 RepID=A0A0A5GC79_9BACI|nr:EAL domain-containing protein [Pontibacillus marinus]KGX88715.1 signal peptide protein [Pontibacillus marinus BH030004 = DSM 16465]
MLASRGLAILTLIISSIVFYGWIITFSDNSSIRLLGVSIISIVGGTLSSTWLYKVYSSTSEKESYFWLLLCLGTLLYVISNGIWLCFQIWGGSSQFPRVSNWIWILEYIIFLGALIYKTQLLSMRHSNNHYIFYILIFMTIFSSISVYYLIKPIISITNSSISISTIILIYPMLNLSILFVTVTLYYLSKTSNNRKVILILISGFFIQVICDSSLIFLRLTGEYKVGGLIEPLWLIAIMLIGLAGVFRKESGKPEENWSLNDDSKKEKVILPYLGVLLFILLAIESYQWKFNALSIGACIIFLLIIIRQFLIMKKNENLTDEYRDLAYHDPLTGLKNRTKFRKDLMNVIDEAQLRNHKVGLLLIDLDRFKYVNDTLGHYTGDGLLKEVSNRLKDGLEVYDNLYRLGGDEYIIILPNASALYCQQTAEAVLKEFTNPFLVNEYEISVTPSIGISVYPENGSDQESLFISADMAMYLAKENGKNNFQFYNAELHEIINRRVYIESELSKAIEKDQLELYYQPKVDLYTKEITGMEALLRWKHPKLGFISPQEFIPLAEETGNIVAIGEWVLKTACKQNKHWQEKGFDPLCISINVSARQFEHSDFINAVSKALDETGLSPQYLELEITESIIQNVSESKEVLNRLRSIGVKLSIDDFGTGYSSLYVLRELPIDVIKIDKSFIDNLTDSKNLSMIKTIIDLGLNLNLHVLAEGIEHEYQVKKLVEQGCSSGQGYQFSRPVSEKDFEALLLQSSIYTIE